jgi:hypothetical protein
VIILDDIAIGNTIKEYRYKGNKYKLCEGENGFKYDLFKYDKFKKNWWIIKSSNSKNDCRA